MKPNKIFVVPADGLNVRKSYDVPDLISQSGELVDQSHYITRRILDGSLVRDRNREQSTQSPKRRRKAEPQT